MPARTAMQRELILVWILTAGALLPYIGLIPGSQVTSPWGIISTDRIFPFLLPLLLWLHYLHWKQARELRALLAGNHLARWEYPPDEWDRFAEAELERASARAKIQGLAQALAYLVICSLVGWLVSESREGLSLGALLGAFFGVIHWGVWHLYGAARHAHRLNDSSGVALIGPHGVCFHGTYRGWSGPGLRLGKCWMEQGAPAFLVFQIRVLVAGTLPAVRIPIPRGREAEAVRLMSQFRREKEGFR